MTRRVPWVLVALGLLPLLAGCGGADCDREPALSWDNFGRGYMETYCTGCHSVLLDTALERRDATFGVDFNTYGDVMKHVERVEARGTGENPTMPPSGGPSEAEIARLEEWLTCTVHEDAAELEQ